MTLHIISTIVLSLILLFCVIFRIKHKFLTISRVIYFVLAVITIVVIIGRIACESVKCFFNLPNYFYQKFYAHKKLFPLDCEECTTDWSLRGGIDEAGLILLGFLLVLIILWIKNENIFFTGKINKLSFFGVVELENLNTDIEKYVNKNDVKLHIKLEEALNIEDEQIIKKASTPDERLDLICNVIEKRIREIYVQKIQEDTPFLNEQILEDLKESKIIDNELKIIVSNFLKFKSENSINKNGKLTIGLIELGRKIMRLLRDVIKKIFITDNKFYGDPQDIKFDRTNIEKKTKEEIILVTTVSLSDSNNNYFQLEDLSIKNFSLIEIIDNDVLDVKINKIELVESAKNKLGIVIAIDSSGSMKENGKLDKSKKAIEVLLSDLLKYNLFEVEVKILVFGNKKAEFLYEDWLSLNSSFNTIINQIDKVIAEGNTPFYEGLLNIHHSFKDEGYKNRNNIIICLSDGDETDNKNLYNDLIKTINWMKIPIISVGFENSNYNELRKISKISGAGQIGVGHFQNVNPTQLEGIFGKIARSLAKSYRIFWKPSSSERGKKIKSRLTVSYKTHHGKVKETTEEVEYRID